MDNYNNLDSADIVYKNEEGVECVEEWKPIQGYEDILKTSNIGRVKRISRYNKEINEILRQRFNKDGYLCFMFHAYGKHKTLPTHRTVAIHFIPNPENKPEVNHKKGIKTDCRFFMLEWSTKAENIQHAYDLGLKKSKTGVDLSWSKLTEKDVLEIRKNTDLSNVKLSEIYNVSHSTIARVRNREIWKHL